MANVKERTNLSENPYGEMPLPRLAVSLESVEEEIDALEKVKDQISKAIADRVEPAVTEARTELEKFEGAVRVAVEGCEVVHTVPKRVEWDTKALDAAAQQIPDASHWIDYKLSISEKKYSAMPDALRSLIDAARTIKHGKAKIEINEAN